MQVTSLPASSLVLQAWMDVVAPCLYPPVSRCPLSSFAPFLSPSLVPFSSPLRSPALLFRLFRRIFLSTEIM